MRTAADAAADAGAANASTDTYIADTAAGTHASDAGTGTDQFASHRRSARRRWNRLAAR